MFPLHISNKRLQYNLICTQAKWLINIDKAARKQLEMLISCLLHLNNINTLIRTKIHINNLVNQ